MRPQKTSGLVAGVSLPTTALVWERLERQYIKKLVKPAAKRAVVQHVQEQHGLSQRRASQLVQCNRTTARYLSRRSNDNLLSARLGELAEGNLALGYRMLCGLLRLDGWLVNHKKVYRLYRDQGLQLRHKGRKRLKSEGRGMPQPAISANEEWALDFVHDSLSDGRSFRTLNMSDAFTRECLAMETDTSLSSERVVRVLEQQVEQRGHPQRLRIDNGPEFRAKPLDVWAKKNGASLFFIEPGKPTQNGQIESFNGRFRQECLNQECLNQEWFTTLKEARQIIEEWRISYNTKRPHSSLGYLPPKVWARRHQDNLQSLYL